MIFFIFQLLASSAFAEDAPVLDQDPHRNKIGFFDIHICNWPERQHFFKILFSTEKFMDIAEMEVFNPSGDSLTVLQKSRFKKLVRKKKPEKRVFIVDMDMPDSATAGWYSIKVKTTDGKEYTARDYVPMVRIKRTTEMAPSSEDSSFSLPVTLTWSKVPGAGFYMVFVRDEWTGEMVFETKLISSNNIKIPEGKLLPGGYYGWRVHARDLNGNILLGDFHMGSMSRKAFFNVAE
ncbi:MAG: hypothetical protein IEMM0001_1576 [bacterium]|nr:MAG: hypothetical protein IEMM0001_1576 [bacterium]